MRSTRRVIGTGLVGLALLLGAGCSSGSNSASDSAAAGKTSDTSSGATSDGGGGCEGTDATVTITETGEMATFDHAGGVSMSDGAAYTVYLADTEVDSSKITMLNTPEPAEGHHLATVFLTVFNPEGDPPPIEEGAKIAFTPDFGVLTFRVVDSTSEKSYNSAADGKGDVTVTKVGSTVCFTIDYSDDEKTLTGTVEASVKNL